MTNQLTFSWFVDTCNFGYPMRVPGGPLECYYYSNFLLAFYIITFFIYINRNRNAVLQRKWMKIVRFLPIALSNFAFAPYG
jgi:hypothetical protein